MSSFEFPQYAEEQATRTMRGLPRFGHTARFAYLFGSQEQRSDYIYGLLFGGVFILAFFFAWTILIPIFKCLGQKRVGFLSGSAFRVSHESKKPGIVRSCFILAAITLVVFSVLLVTKGITQLRTGVDTVYLSATDAAGLLEEAEEFVTSLQDFASDAVPLRDELVAQLNREDFCAALQDQTGTDFSMLVNDTIVFLNELDDFTQAGVQDAKESLEQATDTTEKVQDNVENVQINDWQSLIFIVPFPTFCTVFVVAVLLAWFGYSWKWFTCVITWVVLPLFFLLVIICYILSGGIAIAASANADFCSGGSDQTPDGTIQEIMNLLGFDDEDLEYRVLMFYVEQCDSTDDPLAFLHEYENELANASESVAVLDGAITNTTIDALTEICGAGDYDNTAALLSVVLQRLDMLFMAVDRALELLACETIVPIYTSAFFDGTCTYSIRGVTWTFASFLVIVVMGLLMITFRSSWHPTTYIEDEKMVEAPMEYEGEEVEYTPYNPDQALGQQDSMAEYGLEEASEGDEAAAVVAGVGAADMALSQDNSILASTTDGSSLAAAGANGGEDKAASYDDTNWLDVPAHDAAPQDAAPQDDPPPTAPQQ